MDGVECAIRHTTPWSSCTVTCCAPPGHPGKARVEVTPASGKATVAWDVALVRSSPRQKHHRTLLRFWSRSKISSIEPRDIGRIRVALLGIVLGTAIALVAGHWLAPLLFAESPRDPVVFGMVILVLLGAALLASGIPALRAVRVDPNVALRDE